MDYHLYFHDDFDGIASGAVMLDFLNSRGDSIMFFNPVEYFPGILKKWPAYKFKRPFILVDFRYHPEASWWFDHHPTSFIKKEWQDEFIGDKMRFFAPEFKSCSGAIISHLKKEFRYKPPKHILNLVKWADLVDSASYKSPKQAVECKEPALRLAMFLGEKTENKKTYNLNRENIIKNLAQKPIFQVIHLPFIRQTLKKLDGEARKARKTFGDISVLKGKVVFVDTSGMGLFIPRYLGYLFYPKAVYSVRVESAAVGYHISAGKNPWKKTKSAVDIGKFMAKYGGGGHKDVGGLEKKTKTEILKIAWEIVEYLNENG